MSNSSGSGAIGSGLEMALASRDSVVKGLSEQSRLLTLTSALPEAVLVAERFSGTEGVSEDYRFEIDCLSLSAHLELHALMGEQISLRILLADARRHRAWHGVVLQALQLGSDGGLARYRLVMEPWFACLRQSRNSRIFQDQSVPEIVAAVLRAYPEIAYEFRLNTGLPTRSLCCQYRESDHDFVLRLLASEGLSYVFEHDQGRAHGLSEAPAHSFHTLVIFDAGQAVQACAQAQIRYHRNSATEASDTFQAWQLKQRITPRRVTRSAWDATQLSAPAGSAEIDSAALGGLGDLPELEDHDCDSALSDRHAEAAQGRARFMADYLALQARQFHGEGSVRQLAPATCFTLLDAAGFTGEAARFTVLRVAHQGANNSGSAAQAVPGQTSAQIEPGTYRNQTLCVSAALPIVPRPRAKPAAPGLQSALVVGPALARPDTATASERDGRVCIQFHWQRGTQPNPGGLPHETERATGTLSGGVRVRVAETLAGPNWGSGFTPRVGSEVLIDFDGGDIDHPVVMAQLYNGEDPPPWPAGEHSGANHAGVLAGIHAPTLDGAGWSQWQLDDSTGQLRTRLATSQDATALDLGHLIHHAPTGSQRGAWRGQGFELRTDAWQVQRAAQGMLISTTACPHASSTQLDTTEAASQLKAAADTAQRLSDAASQSAAEPLAQTSRIEALRQTIHPQTPPADGSGQTDRVLKAFEAPAMLIESPGSILFASPASSPLFAGEQLSVTVQADTQLSAQYTASLVSGEASSLYTHAGGIQAIAAHAPLSIQAHEGALEVLADQDVTVTSSNDAIHVLANEKIVLQAGQSSITLEGGNITFACPGAFQVRATQKAFMAGAKGETALEILPSGSMGPVKTNPEAPERFDQFFVLRWSNSGKPMKNQRFTIRRHGGLQTGITDASGRSPLLDTATDEERLSIQILHQEIS